MSLDFIEQIAKLRQIEAVIETISSVCGRLGYSVFGIGAPSRHDLFNGYFFSTWPPEWIELYAREGFMRDDPIPAVAAMNVMPFLWSDMMAGRCGMAMSPGQQRAFQVTQDHGYREGVVVSIHGPGAYLVIASYAGFEPDTSPAAVTTLHILTLHAHVRLAALYAVARQARPPVPGSVTLSAREIEALSCMLSGLSDATAALRMGLTERTVRFHLANARAKLGARTRTQAVSAALALGLLQV